MKRRLRCFLELVWRDLKPGLSREALVLSQASLKSITKTAKSRHSFQGRKTMINLATLHIPKTRTLMLALPALLMALLVHEPINAQTTAPLTPCRIEGFKNEVQCGVLKRPLDPSAPQGVQIDVHYIVVPAVARNKREDAVFFFAGGPGQSAIKIAPQVLTMFTRLNARRDIVLIDQRGTGKSAPLACKPSDDEKNAPLSDAMDETKFAERLGKCRDKLLALPYGKEGGLRFFHSAIALQDADAVRATLGYAKINVIGGSYGTRAGLEYMRQYPNQVRRIVLDGLAPPDMVLIESFGTDNQAAWELLLSACEKDAACAKRYPKLRVDFTSLIASLPKTVSALNPISGRDESFTLKASMLASMLRGPLYAPGIAAALPYVIAEASAGRFSALVGVAGAINIPADNFFYGMHLSVVCAEDAPRMQASAGAYNTLFGDAFSDVYRRSCPAWFGNTKPQVPEAFYTMPASPAPALLLSGGADPATPPRHGERVAKALGAKARHVIVPELGHGVMSQGCTRDMIVKFIDAKEDAEALKLDEVCLARLAKLPRPSIFLPPVFKSNKDNTLGNNNILSGVQQ
jgi:pimeloyl-ACP methyl ester carboxylesterase